MEKQINDKIKELNDGAGSQEELMKALAQIDEDGQLTDDVLDAVSGGTLVRIKVGDATTIGIGDLPTMGQWKLPDDINPSV